MECLEFRRLCDTDPNDEDPAFAVHARSCAACAREHERARKFDALLAAAMRIDVPEGESSRGELDLVEGAASERPFARRAERVWIGLAASLVLAVGAGAGLWLAGRPRAVLAADVVEHIREEPEALREGRPPIDMAAVQSLLAQHGIRLGGEIGRISYVRICPFEGKQVPHLVLEGPSGPVTVMLLLGEHPSRPIPIEQAGFSGRIVPADGGSIVIVGLGGPVDAAEQSRIIDAIAWEA